MISWINYCQSNCKLKGTKATYNYKKSFYIKCNLVVTMLSTKYGCLH